MLLLAVTAHGQGFLKTQGKDIVNEKGEKVILRGMGLGGWMLQEGYMFKLGNIGTQHRIRARIEEVVGKEKTSQFYADWLANHTTKADIDSLAAWGFNSIRLPMHYNLFTLPVEEEKVPGQQTWLDKGFAMTDALLQWCKANRMYLILDLHAAPGGQGNDLNISDRDPAKPSTWDSEANRQKTIALWRKLAERYAHEPWIGGYDIINEPNWGFEDPRDVRGTAETKNAPLRQLMMDITRAIREVDTQHIIIIEGNGFGNNYRGVLPVWDNNMVLSFHKYGNFNNTEAIRGFLNLRDQHNVPIWLGESGENSNTWFTEAIALVESHGIGWAWWQHKKMGLNNPLEIKVPQGYQQLLDYWAGKGPKPSEETAWATLQELLRNVRIENNIPHPDVVDAMFRQVQTTATIPFKKHVVGQQTQIAAVDFDRGRQRYAYYDTDTASYQYTPGVNTRGNRGGAYRNDGVDIRADSNSAWVIAIETGEWMQYTVSLTREGKYDISFEVAAASDTGRIAVLIGETPATDEIAVPDTGGEKNWHYTQPAYLYLKGKTLSIRVLARKGGYHLRTIRLTRRR